MTSIASANKTRYSNERDLKKTTHNVLGLTKKHNEDLEETIEIGKYIMLMGKLINYISTWRLPYILGKIKQCDLCFRVFADT